MRARTPEAAVDAFVARLRRITACVTDRPLFATGRRLTSLPQAIAFLPGNDPVPLRPIRSRRTVALAIKLDYMIDRVEAESVGHEIRIVAYRYQIVSPDGREVLAYHWHPTGVSPVTFPHVHLGSGLRPIDLGSDAAPVALAEMHLPTGPVSLADVVRLLIMEFDVAPRRSDWQTILQAAAS